ncbi:MAG: hypothetical protein HY706_19975 [Candidatus Hydrogenedentes bacterium]|nr:hypothetical protein [Candidatus Hydrogenedentota bacterium]
MFSASALATFFLITAAWDEPPEVVVWDEELGGEYTRAVRDATGARAVTLENAEALAGTLLVLPECRVFPAARLQALGDYVNNIRGHLLAVGGPAFEALVYRDHAGKWVPKEELLATVTAEHPLIDWKTLDLAKCNRGSSQKDAYVHYAPISDGYSAELDLIEPVGWETVELPCTPTPSGDDVLWFRASGSDKTKALLIEVRERDGSRWMATASVSESDTEIGLHVSQFQFWRDSWSQGRGGPGDQVNLSNAGVISVGFAASHQPLEPGRYGYTVRGLATGKIGPEFAEAARAEVPRLEGLCPSYKAFEAQPVRCEALGLAAGIGFGNPNRIISPVARPMRWVEGRDYVWQPLVKAYNERGEWCATACATTWRQGGATWTYVGFQPEPKALAELARRLATTLTPRALAEMKLIPRPETALSTATGKPPIPAIEPGVGPLLEATERGECVSVKDGHFMLDGKRWFAHGINFWPLHVSGLDPKDYFLHWLTPQYYVPECLDQDLATLESLGVNLVSIQYHQAVEAPQLRDFVTRCGRHGIKVNIFLEDAHPTEPSAGDDLSQRRYLELLKAADLAGNPHVFAYDLAWEPRLGTYQNRRKYDRRFEQWLVEQYGSVDHAEKLWNCPANRKDGKLTGPWDEQLIWTGPGVAPHRVMVAAYRRFADDLISRRYREVIRLARKIDATHLFGARTGYGGTGTPGVVTQMQFQLTSGAAHLDFVSPEGYGYGPMNIADAAFVNQYARWAGNGKPTFWAEFGLSVWKGGEPALKQQGELYTAFAEMAQRTGADGWAGWWYPGGYRVDENSDYGIIAPDRTPRPSAEVLRHTAASFREGSGALTPGEPIVVDRDLAPQGLAAIVTEHSKVFAESYNAGKLPTVATAGTGLTSTNCPFISVGGVPFEKPSPTQFLNAEITVLKREPGTIEVELINTGEAIWMADDCHVVVETTNGTRQLSLPKDVPRFGRRTVEINDVGSAQITMASTRFGTFGERLNMGL